MVLVVGWILVGELRSYMPRGRREKKKERNGKNIVTNSTKI